MGLNSKELSKKRAQWVEHFKNISGVKQVDIAKWLFSTLKVTDMDDLDFLVNDIYMWIWRKPNIY
jgi:hypothetical protein